MLQSFPSASFAEVGMSQLVDGAVAQYGLGDPAGSASTGPTRLPTVREITITIPAGAEPGRTRMRVAPGRSGDGASPQLIITVPMWARPGDELTLIESADGTWTCVAEDSGPQGGAAGARQPIPSVAPEAPAMSGPEQHEVRVPMGAVPGETQVAIGVGAGEPLLLTLPPHALPRDILKLQREAGGKPWKVLVQREQEGEPSVVELPPCSMDPNQAFRMLVQAAHKAGAFVNPSIARGAPPPHFIPGLVATTLIEEGDVLFRIPASMQMSPSACKQRLQTIFCPAAYSTFIAEDRREEQGLAVCLMALLQDISKRFSSDAAARRSVDPTGLSSVPEVWKAYAAALLGTGLETHPWLAVSRDHAFLAGLLSPSSEIDHATMMTGDVWAIHDVLVRLYTKLLKEVNASFFRYARLCILSRAFYTPHGTSLVPLVDFCNHSADPVAHQRWELEGDAMVVKALRRIKPGEEITLSYGVYANTTLFRTYGFTLPPEEEPLWGFNFFASELQGLPSNVAPAQVKCCIAVQFLDLEEVSFKSNALQPSLSKVLDGCDEGNGDAAAVLRTFCKMRMALYHEDCQLKAPLAALAQARRADVGCHSWWEHWDDDASWFCQGAYPGECMPSIQDAVRVKMSEYLCLQAHVEAVDAAAGKLQEERCLRLAAPLRRALAERLGCCISSPGDIGPNCPQSSGGPGSKGGGRGGSGCFKPNSRARR